MISGPIVLIDDDKDDLDLLTAALKELQVKNEILVFNNAHAALSFFQKTETKPFLVLCDINMPEVNGFELRRKIYNKPRLWRGSFPFLFLSTAHGYPGINDAFDMNVQGYFVKPPDIDELLEMLKSIISYWTWSRHPVIS